MTTVETDGLTAEATNGAESAPGLTGEQLARLRETLITAYPDAVPELVAGGDFEALLASVDPAREAYQRVRDAATREALASVPRGGATRSVDTALLASLGPEAKIAAAMRGR